MIDRVALTAPSSPPDTGASRNKWPRSAAWSANRTATSGLMVEKSTMTVPGLACVNTPSDPVSACSTSGESGSTVATMSASATASAMDCAAVPPASMSAAAFDAVRL
ncbi:Uncharacterised protein [Mycobacteroides abscessus subsp. abscessus]|nr:Uncharacterised protein [Mycobacteroides abscessus subsp. abscessus]